MIEIWIAIKGFENKYEVSNLGRIRSIDRIVNSSHNATRISKGKILKKNISSSGYEIVCLSSYPLRKYIFAHVLVASHFLDKQNGKDFVNHKNGIKTCNIVTNLEWCTRSENMIHAYKTGLLNLKNCGESHSRSILTLELVKKIKYHLNNNIKVSDIARIIGIKPSAIYSIKKGETWKHVV